MESIKFFQTLKFQNDLALFVSDFRKSNWPLGLAEEALYIGKTNNSVSSGVVV